MLMPTILVVDDEPRIRDVVQYALEREGFSVICTCDGLEALRVLQAQQVDLIVLDVLMPELDGLSLCRKVRETKKTPIIFLSSRSDELDRILGLELGGDDYVTKPFSPRELATRVKTVLRRSGANLDGATAETPSKIVRHGSITMDIDRHEVRVGERIIDDFTVTEFAVLCSLLEHPGRVLTRSQLIDRAYQHDNHITERTIDTHIRRIRAKIRPFGIDPIQTIHGLGYKSGELG